MPLAAAYLCQDCDSVGNSSTHCLACASEVLLGLAAVLDREVVEEEEGGKKLGTPQWAVN
jgi:hypothetical protein